MAGSALSAAHSAHTQVVASAAKGAHFHSWTCRRTADGTAGQFHDGPVMRFSVGYCRFVAV